MQLPEITPAIIQADLVHQLGIPDDLDWDYFLETAAKTPALNDVEKIRLLMRPAPGKLQSVDTLRRVLREKIDGSEELDWEEIIRLSMKAKTMADIDNTNMSEHPRTPALIIRDVIPFEGNVFDANMQGLEQGTKFFASVWGVVKASPLGQLGVLSDDILFCEMLEASENPLVRVHNGSCSIELRNNDPQCFGEDWLVYEGMLDGTGFIDDRAKQKAEDLCEHMNLRA